MENSRQYLTGKQAAGLLYVIIAIATIGLATVESHASFEWYSAAYNLDLHVSNVFFHTDGQPLGYPYVTVIALVSNPSNFNGITLSDANYAAYVNSTSELFSVQGSSEVGMRDFGFGQPIPGSGSLNLTNSFQILLDTNTTLTNFLKNHQGGTSNDLIIFVGITLYFQSSFGRYNIPYCYELPKNILTICPSPRIAPDGGARG